MQFNKKILLGIIGVIALSTNLLAQTNIVPAEAKEKTAPFVFTPESVKSGDQIYQANCKSCHGDPGKGNYAKLVSFTIDPASAEYQKFSDGEMFYILSHGRGLMPNFVNTLTEEQRWNVISYIRTFNKDYKQPPVKAAGEAVKTETAKMVLAYDAEKKQLFATVTDSVSGVKKPLPNIAIKLFVKRTFGNMAVSNAETNSSGVAYFDIPNDIPGDTIGKLSFIAKTVGNSKELSTTIDENIGVITKPKRLLDERTWWNVNKMAPIWLILLYLSGVTGAGATVVYILLQLRKIKKINQNK